MKLGGFAKCRPVTARYEGGFANNPKDPGGVTLNGVTQRVYDAWRRNQDLKTRPLTPTMNGNADWNRERDAIYKKQYWDAVRGDELPAGIDLAMYDAAVHSGPFQSVKWLQKSLAAARLYRDEVDGHFGVSTMDALNSHPDHDLLIAEMLARRLGMLQHLETWPTFGGGWSKRIANCKAICQSWATGTVGPPPIDPSPVEENAQAGNGKAYASDVAQPAVDAGDAVKAGVGSGALGATVDGAKDALMPVAYSSDWVMKIVTILTVISVVIAIGSIGYSIWASRKTKRAQRAIDGDILADVPEGQPA